MCARCEVGDHIMCHSDGAGRGKIMRSLLSSKSVAVLSMLILNLWSPGIDALDMGSTVTRGRELMGSLCGGR